MAIIDELQTEPEESLFDHLAGLDEETLFDSLDMYLEQADTIVESLLDIVFANELLLIYDTPAEAVQAASELWDAARDIAAGVVSARMNLDGLPIDLGYFGDGRG